MKTRITFCEALSVSGELPLYATLPPSWNDERVAELGARLRVRGTVVDAGPWYVVRDGVSSLEVYQASHSLRLSRDDFDAEGRTEACRAPERDRALAVASGFQQLLGGSDARAELHSVTELEVTKAVRGRAETETRVVGLQVNYRYTLHGLPLIGPGAKAQVTVGPDGELVQAYRFWRESTLKGTRRTVTPEQAFERFSASGQFAELPSSAKVEVVSAHLGLLCLPPTEVQGVLVPAYVLRGEVSTELHPRHQFVSYVAAVEVEEVDAKRNRWSLARPSLLIA